MQVVHLVDNPATGLIVRFTVDALRDNFRQTFPSDEVLEFAPHILPQAFLEVTVSILLVYLLPLRSFDVFPITPKSPSQIGRLVANVRCSSLSKRSRVAKFVPGSSSPLSSSRSSSYRPRFCHHIQKTQ